MLSHTPIDIVQLRPKPDRRQLSTRRRQERGGRRHTDAQWPCLADQRVQDLVSHFGRELKEPAASAGDGCQ
jgi:hypothetical protein